MVCRGSLSLGPMMVVNEHVNEFFFAAAAGGGVIAPTAMVHTALDALVAGKRLDRAVAMRAATVMMVAFSNGGRPPSMKWPHRPSE